MPNYERGLPITGEYALLLQRIQNSIYAMRDNLLYSLCQILFKRLAQIDNDSGS